MKRDAEHIPFTDTGSYPIRAGNAVRPLVDGVPALQRICEAVDAALGARLRMRRTRLRLTQAELGRALGVSYQQIQKYESGANRLRGSALIAACRVLRVLAR